MSPYQESGSTEPSLVPVRAFFVVAGAVPVLDPLHRDHVLVEVAAPACIQPGLLHRDPSDVERRVLAPRLGPVHVARQIDVVELEGVLGTVVAATQSLQGLGDARVLGILAASFEQHFVEKLSDASVEHVLAQSGPGGATRGVRPQHLGTAAAPASTAQGKPQVEDESRVLVDRRKAGGNGFPEASGRVRVEHGAVQVEGTLVALLESRLVELVDAGSRELDLGVLENGSADLGVLGRSPLETRPGEIDLEGGNDLNVGIGGCSFEREKTE
ncbi:hypothetical protein DFJ74DRAFT_695432 [Hyaloraphidium curvatum]|nr:hypothetical protein DFJ74DRAFT_695432 [Hyaloraphidium curvatum]